jgi:prefoldin subunit 5
MNFSIDSTELIYLVLGPGILVLITLLLRHDLRLKAQCEELKSRLVDHEDRLAQLRETVSDDSRSRELQAQVARLTQQHEQLMRRDSETGPYFRAVRFAENGAGVDALIEQTGVTRTEAELIVSLHSKSRAAATVAE